MTKNSPVKITYFSDVLCIWAYCAQIRLDELKSSFGDQVRIEQRFISVFGNTKQKIGEGWQDRGGFEGYDQHVHDVAEKFIHADVLPGLWVKTRPASSASPHLFLKALDVAENNSQNNPANGAESGPLLEKAIWALREAFFRDGRDIARLEVQWEIAAEQDLPIPLIKEALENGAAMAALCSDYDLQRRQNVEGSPTFILNEGRQRLFGNVGYKVIEANILELLRSPDQTLASWC